MTAVKERIIGAVSIMSDKDANIFWHIIQKHFKLPPRDRLRLRRRKGRPQDADQEHRLRVRRVQHPVQRHGPGLYRHRPDRPAA